MFDAPNPGGKKRVSGRIERERERGEG